MAPAWTACPGGPFVGGDPERLEARCPRCDYTFSTLFTEGSVPPHYVSDRGTVAFVGTDA